MTEQELTQRLFAAELAKRELKPEYQTSEMRDIIYAAVKRGVAEKCDFKLSEAGQLEPVQKSDNSLFLFEGNKRQTIDDLLKPFQKYFANPEDKQKEPQADPLEGLPPGLKHMHYMHRNYEH